MKAREMAKTIEIKRGPPSAVASRKSKAKMNYLDQILWSDDVCNGIASLDE